MIERFVDISKVKINVDCIEMGREYIGERVTGRKIKAFELVEAGCEEDRIKIVGELNGFLGIIVRLSGIDDLTASALENLISEIMNQIKGLRYDFKKDRVVITVSEETYKELSLDCIAKIIYNSFKSLGIGNVCVELLADKDLFEKELARSRIVHKRRENIKIREEDVEDFYGCISCQINLPNHVCVITPERPSPCGTVWNEAKVANELGIVEYYFKIEKGKEIDGEFEGVNNAVSRISNGEIRHVKLHSVLNNPPSTGLYSELIVFYIPEKDGFGIVDREFTSKTPIGLSFNEIERIIVGKQVEGFVGISYAYLKSKKFLKDEGGWQKISWVSPNVHKYAEKYVKSKYI